MRKPLRVCIDARITDGVTGGMQQFILGLASGLSSFGDGDGDEEYVFLVNGEQHDWLLPYVSGRCSVVAAPTGDSALPKLLRQRARGGWRAVSPLLGERTVSIPRAPVSMDELGVDVVHFATQNAFATDRPSLYQPWDLQHVHLPSFTGRRERLVRRVRYREFARRAEVVLVATEWGRRDLVEHLGLPPTKIAVVSLAPPTAAYSPLSTEEAAEIRRRLRLPDDFVLYPAQTWPHKNHLGLLEAVAHLRETQGLLVPVVCPGDRNRFFPTIRSRLESLELQEQVRFPGYLAPREIAALYAAARCLVFPSLFEGWGFPISEAFLAGVPVACSDGTCLPEVVDDAALLFDPRDPVSIGVALLRVWTDEELREKLREKGRVRVAARTWSDIAEELRQVYRRLGRRETGAANSVEVAA